MGDDEALVTDVVEELLVGARHYVVGHTRTKARLDNGKERRQSTMSRLLEGEGVAPCRGNEAPAIRMGPIAGSGERSRGQPALITRSRVVQRDRLSARLCAVPTSIPFYERQVSGNEEYLQS